jgi:hypothetical protein
MRTTLCGSPQAAQSAYLKRQQTRQARRFAFFALLVVASNSLLWFGVFR